MSDESESEQSEAGEEPEVEEFNEHKLSDQQRDFLKELMEDIPIENPKIMKVFLYL